jgi:chromosome partitioning protein
MSRIIAVSNQKGGVGKTTTSVNLAACVAEKGRRVLLVDIDPQGNASSGLGVTERTPSVYDVLLGEAKAEAAIRRTEFDNLSVLPSDIALAGAEIELVAIPERETLLRRALEGVRDQFDYIFIDCPPSLSLLTLNAMTAADSVLIPIQCEYYALEGVGQLMNTLQLVKKRLNPALEIEGVVLTMLDGRTNLGLQVVQEVKKYFKSRVYGSIIPRNVRLSEAPSHGEPINVYDSRSTGAEAYRALAAEFIEWDEGEEE